MTERPVRIERLAAAEVDVVSALAREVWQATYPTLISQAQIDAMLAERYAAESIRAQLGDAAQGWWIARAADRIVGLAHVTMAERDARLDKLYVHPDWQRKGVGGALVAAAKAWATERAVKRVVLQVNRGNAAATKAYQRYGFVIVEARVFDIGNGFVMDDYIMAQDL